MKAVCVQCRVRKVRCDGKKPCCKTCERLRFQCSFQQANAPIAGNYTPRLPPKCRGTRACTQCRSMKVRCSGETPRCSNCKRRDRPCTYAAARPSAASDLQEGTEEQDAASFAAPDPADVGSLDIAAQPPTLSPSSPAFPADDIVRDMVDRFFEYLYPLPSYNFLHKDTVTRRCQEDTINEALKLAICGITALFTGVHKEFHHSWIEKAESLILDRLERPSIFHLQAWLLIVRYRAEAGQFPRAFMTAGIAARSAVALRLNYEHADLGPVAQEVRRRTVWSLYLLEDIFCIGLKEFELIQPEIIHLRLPGEDSAFGLQRDACTGYLQPGKGIEPDTLSTRGIFVKLAYFRRAIMRLNRRIFFQDVDLADLLRSIEQFRSDLVRLQTQFAPSDRYPPPNLNGFEWQPQYVMLHMAWHQAHCDLYRIFMTGYPEAAPPDVIKGIRAEERAWMRDRCLNHAEEIVKILSDFHQYSRDTQLLEVDAAMCAYQSARLILFGAHTAKGKSSFSMQSAICKAQMNLDVISRFFAFSAPIQPMKEDLDRLIKQYQSLVQSWDGAVLKSDHSPQPEPKVSSDANIRQRLSIHSLLLRSEFLDDSRDAASEPPSEQPMKWDATQAEDPQGLWMNGIVPDMAMPDPSMFFSLSYGGAAAGFDAWSAFPVASDMSGFSVDEQGMY